MTKSIRGNIVLVFAASLFVGAACLSPQSSGGGSGGKANGGSGGGSGGNKAGGAGGSGGSGGSAAGGSSASGGSAAGGSSGSGGSSVGGSSGGSSSGGAGSGGSGGSAGGSGGGSGGKSGGAGGSGGGSAGSGGTAGAGGSAGSGGAGGAGGSGTGGTQPDAGTDSGKTDGLGADRPTDVAGRDTAPGPDVAGTDAGCSPACASGQTCVSGQCMCSNGLGACGADCVDLNTSVSHCGSCPIVCASGQTCSNGACVEGGSTGLDGCTDTLASNLTLKQIAVYQSVKIPVMQDGAEVAVASRNASVVPGRDTMFRVFVTLGTGWAARELAARLTLTPPGGTPVQYFSRKTISAASVDADLKTTFQIFVPPAAMVASPRYSVDVVECGSASGTPGQARFPASGDADLGTKNTGPLKVKIIPLQAGTLLPDTSATALTGYANYLRAMYPANTISITVGDTLTTATPVDWEGMLDEVRAKRAADKPANDIYYFGLVKPADTFATYCRSSCTTGIGYVVTGTGSTAGSARAAIGVAYSDSYSWETMAHELGHNHGRNHAPCVSGGGTISGVDSKFPYSTGGIGSWGYDARTQKLFDPAKGKDIMGYCTNQWVSDYTYVAMTARVASVNGAAMIYTPASALSRWRVLMIGLRGPRWGIPIKDEVVAEGTPEQATIYDKSGAVLTAVDVYRTEMSEGFGNMYMVPEPQPGWYAVAVAGAPALPFKP